MGTRVVSGVAEAALEEGKVEERGEVGGVGVKSVPRRYIDLDGAM